MPLKKSAVAPPKGVVTAMFTDIVDSTRLKGLMPGDTSARRDAHFRQEIKAVHDRIVLACVEDSGGYMVNPTGDGFCFTFVDAEEAVLCALRIQRNLQLQPIETPLGPLLVRIGLHTGIAGPTGGDYIATMMDKAARVQGKADGGEILISNQTWTLIADRIFGVIAEKEGTFDLKGLVPEELYSVRPDSILELAPVDTSSRTSKATRTAGVLGLMTLLGLGAVGVLSRSLWAPSSPLAPQATPSKALAVSAGTAGVKKTAQATAKPVSKWYGAFHFLPPMPRYDGSVELTITRLQGEHFQGEYASEERKWVWLVEGTLKGRDIRWEFTKSTKNPGTEDAVGKAFCAGTIQGDRLKGIFQMRTNPKEKAELNLRRES